MGRGKDILVYIRQGNYSLNKPLVFAPEDGGERVETNLPTGAFEYHKLKDHYVTYAAYPGEKPVITTEVPVTGWRLGGKVWTARFEADTAAMLIVNGKRQVLARTPNEGYFVPQAISKTTGELSFRTGEIRAWNEMENNRVVKTAGMTFNSVVRRNLIHDVHACFFNDNVGFWFDKLFWPEA